MVPETYVKTVLDIWSECREKTSHTVEGNCMSPLIREGDSIVIEHGRRDITAGDIVVARILSRYNVQRVLRREVKDGSETYLLKGDQSALFYESVSRGDIVGKVVEVSGSNGRLTLDSLFWKGAGSVLLMRSVISVRRMKADSLLWKCVNGLFAIRAALFPGRRSLSLFPFRCICFVSGKWFQISKRYLNKS